MTKQEIFDQYAQEQWYKNFEEIVTEYRAKNMSLKAFTNHIFNTTDLVCKQALENAYQNTPEIAIRNNEWGTIKQSITNSENIPK